MRERHEVFVEKETKVLEASRALAKTPDMQEEETS
jgi:hypothetical protein